MEEMRQTVTRVETVVLAAVQLDLYTVIVEDQAAVMEEMEETEEDTLKNFQEEPDKVAALEFLEMETIVLAAEVVEHLIKANPQQDKEVLEERGLLY